MSATFDDLKDICIDNWKSVISGKGKSKGKSKSMSKIKSAGQVTRLAEQSLIQMPWFHFEPGQHK